MRKYTLLLCLPFIIMPSLAIANSGDFSGSVAIGTSYSGVVTAPTNGLIVQGIVGLGLNNPTLAPLQTSGVIGSTAAIFAGNTTGISLTASNPTIAFNAYYNSNWFSLQSGYGGMIMHEQSAGSMLFMLSTASVAGQGTTYTTAERVRITKDGYVGIGTTAPHVQLTISGGAVNTYASVLRSTSSVQAGLELRTDASNRAVLYQPGSTNDFRIFLADPTGGNRDVFAIQASTGNTGIGNTSPSSLFHVGSGSASGGIVKFQNSSGTCTHTPSSSSETVSCSSDIRFKKSVQDSRGALNLINDMRVRDFTLKSTEERKTGVVAQEIMLKHPEMVRVNSDGTYLVDQPNPWVLVKAMQELDDKIAEQKSEIEQLKRTIEHLRR